MAYKLRRKPPRDAPLRKTQTGRINSAAPATETAPWECVPIRRQPPRERPPFEETRGELGSPPRDVRLEETSAVYEPRPETAPQIFLASVRSSEVDSV